MNSEQASFGTGRTKGRDATTGVICGRYALSVGEPNVSAPQGWRWTPLSEVAQLESGHTPSRSHPEYWDGDVPWIGIKDAVENHGRTIHDTIQHTNQLGLANSSARLLPANTVCLSRTASVGFVTVTGQPMATSQDFVNWICGPDIDFRYLKFVLVAENESLWRFASGTTHQTIYYPEAKAFHVMLPPLPEQRAIARILGSLDEQIELNRRQNATLERMAQTLFRSWFVRFDPVHARAAGAAPEGLDPQTAALFPDSFDGDLPRGWKQGAIADMFNVTMGQSPPGDTYNETGEGVEFYQGRTDFGFRFPMARVYCTDNTARRASKGDTLLSVRAPVGDVNVAAKDCCIGRGVASLRQKTGCLSFGLYTLQNLRARLDNFNSEGTVFGSVNKASLSTLPVVVPPDDVLLRCEEVLSALDAQIEVNTNQSRTLARLRDELLPRLVSGRLRVPDAFLKEEARGDEAAQAVE